MKVLIVDDKEENVYLLESLLKGSGYEVVSATNGAEALEKLRAEGIDLIISDILMPVIDGFQLCRQCKGDEELKLIPFVFYTATYTDGKDEDFALTLGADRYVRKPVEPDEFIKIIQGVLRDAEEGKIVAKKPPLEEEEEIFKLYSQRLVAKLERKMLALEEEMTERKRAEERIVHLNAVLRAIRRVNQLIVTEKDQDTLLKGACENLIETRGYYNAWIALIDESGELVTTAEAGLGEDFLPLVEDLKRSQLPHCASRALSEPGVLIIEDPSSTCEGCPLVGMTAGKAAMTCQLESDGNVYGVLSVSVTPDYAADEEERSLFAEVVGDIGFGLRGMELERERRRAEEALQQRTYDLAERVKELNCLYGISALVEKPGISLPEFLQRAVDLIPVAWQYPEIACARIILEGQEYKTENFRETTWKQTSDIILDGEQAGAVELCYLEEKPASDEGPFLKEERNLINAVGERLGRITERKRAEEALRKSEGKYRTLVENLPQKIFLKDKDSVYISCNESYAHDLEVKPDEIAGKTDYDFHPKELADRYRADDRRVVESGETVDVEEPYIQDGNELWVHTVKTPVRDASGNVVAILGIFRDITDRKRAEEALREREENFGALAENLGDGVYILSLEGKRVYANSRAAEILGYRVDEFLELDLGAVADPDERARMIEMHHARLAGEPLPSHYESTYVRKDGTPVPVEVMVTVTTWRGERACLVSIRDITERKRAEEELRRTFSKLQKIVEGAVQTMARIVEIRDPYTAGHQQRVAALAGAIGVELHLPEDQVAGLYMAAAIHDVGKISVPAEILSKPGRLTDTEFDIIKAHSFIGYDILSGIEFPWPIADIVLQHHERTDGSGYPKGLAGEDIRLEARILGVADVVEAMASHRPYRPARGLDMALEEISQNKGVLYDPPVADACLRLFAEKGFKLE